ncbi:uncharacterized protein LOC107364378 [Tetranychus urticae]|uniref:Uncharacterized protein n=1 Tax=Tetranychus urticae TaxID=32264 RepID=T1KII8_TETUR|nr:uncharacterized protein LOC107364378 [Tetranychus urticae]
MFPLVGSALYFMFNVPGTVFASNSIYSSRKFFEKYKKYCKVKMPSHCDDSISLEKVIQKETLETEYTLEPELLVSHEDKGKNRGKKSKKAIAAERIARTAVVYECVYCGRLMDSLYYLKFHVIGQRRSIYKGYYVLRIDCPKRLQMDGLSYNKKLIPISCPPPKIKVWANIICQDPRVVDAEGYFPVPIEIASEWEQFYSQYMI